GGWGMSLEGGGSGEAISSGGRCGRVAELSRGTAGLRKMEGRGPAKRACRWLGLARRNGLERGLAQETRDRAAQAHDLRLLARGRIAVAGRVNGVEAGFNSVAILGPEQLERELDGDRVLLPDITHVRRALDRDAGNGDVAA